MRMNSRPTSRRSAYKKQPPRCKSSFELRRVPSTLVGRNIDNHLLRSLTSDPLGSITFLDLSFSGIQRINGIFSCPNIEIAILHGNCIDSLPDFRWCKQLWKLDLSCNKLNCLNGFEYYTSFGTLVLCENDLDWKELLKIRHMQVMNLSLIGNDKLTRDVNYRKHVIINLPSLWSLDGDLITAAERSCVGKFFQSTIRSKNPVWLKLPRKPHVPTFMTVAANVSFGHRAVEMSINFAKNETHNKALDQRRLFFQCKGLEKDACLELSKTLEKDLILNIFKSREESAFKCNMLLIILACSLLFSIPAALMKQALEIIDLEEIGSVACEEIFKQPLQVKTFVVSLLTGYVKLDIEDSVDNGINKLQFNALKALNTIFLKVAYGSSDVSVESNLHHIMAAELVKVFCRIPNFMDFLQEASILEIIASATRNKDIGTEINAILQTTASCCSGQVLVELIMSQMKSLKGDDEVPDLKISCRKNTREAQLEDKNSYNLWPVEQRLRARPKTAPAVISHEISSPHSNEPTHRKFFIGDKVFLSSQRAGHIIAIPDKSVVLVQLDTLPKTRYWQADCIGASNFPENSLSYVNVDSVAWDRTRGIWVTQNDTPSINYAKYTQSQHGNETTRSFRKPIDGDIAGHLTRRSDKQNLKGLPADYSDRKSEVDRIIADSMKGGDEKASNRLQLLREHALQSARHEQWKNYDKTPLLTLSNKYSKTKEQPNELTCFRLGPS